MKILITINKESPQFKSNARAMVQAVMGEVTERIVKATQGSAHDPKDNTLLFSWHVTEWE